jgi:hypothetical protein
MAHRSVFQPTCWKKRHNKLQIKSLEGLILEAFFIAFQYGHDQESPAHDHHKASNWSYRAQYANASETKNKQTAAEKNYPKAKTDRSVF